MKSTLIRITIISSILTTTAIPALAAAIERSNTSEPIVWGFLGLCALIIIAQIAPMIFNIKKQPKITVEETKTAKEQH